MTEPMRPVEFVEEHSDVGTLVILAPFLQCRIQLLFRAAEW